jgi:Helix-turn-helix of DDE superfamily endonuclease
MTRHRFHGDWNYTLHPHSAPAPSPPPGQQQSGDHVPNRAMLCDPELTGIPRAQLDELTATLAEPQAAQRERHRHARRGTARRRAPGAGRHPKLTDADRVLATVLYLRRLCTQAVLGELFQVDRKVITTAVQDIRPILEQHGYTITPSTARFPTPADLIAFLANDSRRQSKIKPAC